MVLSGRASYWHNSDWMTIKYVIKVTLQHLKTQLFCSSIFKINSNGTTVRTVVRTYVPSINCFSAGCLCRNNLYSSDTGMARRISTLRCATTSPN